MRIPKDVWITAGVMVGMGVLFVTLVWWPARQQAQRNQARIKGAAERVSQVSTNEAELLRLTQEVEDLEALLARDEHIVPDAPELPSLLRGLTESVRDRNVVDQNLSAGNFERYADYAVVPVSINFRASFLEAAGVIESLEKQRRLTSLKRTVLGVEGPNDTAVAAQLELAAYYTTDPEVMR